MVSQVARDLCNDLCNLWPGAASGSPSVSKHCGLPVQPAPSQSVGAFEWAARQEAIPGQDAELLTQETQPTLTSGRLPYLGHPLALP